MGDPSPWLTLAVDSVAAVGAAGAAIVAVVLANREQRERRETRREINLLKDREARQEARRVVFAVQRAPSKRPGIVHLGQQPKEPAKDARWRVTVKNLSERAVHDVVVTVWPVGSHDRNLRIRVPLAELVPPGEEATLRTSAHAAILGAEPAFVASFTDASGREWRTDEVGIVRDAEEDRELPFGRPWGFPPRRSVTSWWTSTRRWSRRSSSRR